MDVIVSPVRPWITHFGDFDGFPTGCSIEAGLAGAAVLHSDPLKSNIKLSSQEIQVITTDPDEICGHIWPLLQDPEALAYRRHRTREAFERVFGYGAQMGPRIDALQQLCSTAALS